MNETNVTKNKINETNLTGKKRRKNSNLTQHGHCTIYVHGLNELVQCLF